MLHIMQKMFMAQLYGTFNLNATGVNNQLIIGSGAQTTVGSATSHSAILAPGLTIS